MKKMLFIILASVLLGGCNTVNMAYRNADWYLEHQVNEYATFNGQQQQVIRQDVSTYIRWHREKMLPDYITFLQDLNQAAQADGPLTVADATRLRTRLRDLYRATMQPMIAPAAKMLASMDTGQIAELEKHFSEVGQRDRQETLGISREEYLEKRSKRTLSFMRWLAGSLSDQQEQKILEMSRNLPTTGDIYQEQQETYRHKLIAMLKNHASETEIAAFLTSWLFNPDAILSAGQQKAMQASALAWDKMIAQTHGLLTGTQKAHIRELTSGYIDEMNEAMQSHARDAATQ